MILWSLFIFSVFGTRYSGILSTLHKTKYHPFIRVKVSNSCPGTTMDLTKKNNCKIPTWATIFLVKRYYITYRHLLIASGISEYESSLKMTKKCHFRPELVNPLTSIDAIENPPGICVSYVWVLVKGISIYGLILGTRLYSRLCFAIFKIL